jgi:hypothetical protein
MGIRSRFLLLVDRGAAASSRDAARQLSESFSNIVELRLRPHGNITLVRPDGYIAFSASHNGAAELEAVRSVLQRQTA